MTSIRLRPCFKDHTALAPSELEERIRLALKTEGCPCEGTVIHGFVVLRILQCEQHFWSPQLSLSIEKDEELNETVVRGLYGPKPTIWAMFAFGYGALGVLFLFTSIVGFSALSLGNEAHVLWALPVLAGIAVGLYFTAQMGQKLGAEQTFTLHHFYEKTIGKRISVS